MGKVIKSTKTYSLEEIIEIIEKLPSEDKTKLISCLGKEKEIVDTHFLSEKTLSKDWDSNDEDEAWKDL